ncbi:MULTISPECIES: exonuclease domain-containing protein [Limosilactobacillus]|uniref:exonuclease domain-containing protein n=1 Tax=Limosilactobacillus TaxID=2742598 RepID=UPI001F2A2C55|nr:MULTISPECIES: exonuclease domain-containing protein [Limosilactobacillus]
MVKCYTSFIYWIDTTGLDWQSDEIIHLTITDLLGNIVFSHLFKPVKIKSWDPTLQGFHITLEDVANQPAFNEYLPTLQKLFNQVDTLIGFGNTTFDDWFLQQAEIKLPQVMEVDVQQQLFKRYQLFDHAPSIYECADYFHYPLNPKTADYTDYLKAVAYCYCQILEKYTN